MLPDHGDTNGDDDRVYITGATGMIFCLDAATGEVLWEKEALRITTPTSQFGAPQARAIEEISRFFWSGRT
ncbi:MAG: hypothetical protein Ct9H300mP25_17770 [Acidobacteriota bacterium]|nr:MAG: hypothetical protein Ct9H300mP25_17770 [Acidobacteriota bacterium]